MNSEPCIFFSQAKQTPFKSYLSDMLALVNAFSVIHLFFILKTFFILKASYKGGSVHDYTMLLS